MSCYAFFNGWLLPGLLLELLSDLYHLITSQALGALSYSLGCFPFDV